MEERDQRAGEAPCRTFCTDTVQLALVEHLLCAKLWERWKKLSWFVLVKLGSETESEDTQNP